MFLKCMNSNKKIIAKVNGTTTDKRLVARSIYSYCPESNSQSNEINESENPIKWDTTLMSKVSITDSILVKYLLDQFFIFPEKEVTRIDIYDVTNNGFGEKDIAETYPDRSIYFLEFVNEEAQQVMRKWKMPENYESIGENLDPNFYEADGLAQSGVLASILRGVKRNVKRSPVTIWFRQDSTGIFLVLLELYL